ncbi:hypothetical protein BDC45DRAFT_519067 [Circinella umbellata]|nr:hypothetical protein BDC45DRAFT_519067 [Circinella umbellata]
MITFGNMSCSVAVLVKILLGMGVLGVCTVDCCPHFYQTFHYIISLFFCINLIFLLTTTLFVPIDPSNSLCRKLQYRWYFPLIQINKCHGSFIRSKISDSVQIYHY